jgi:beta-glucanase (GH16 family)
MKVLPYTIFSIFLFCGQLSFSQQMPIDFSDANDNFTGFSGSSFSPNTDPQNNSNAVGQFFNDGSNATQGFYIDLNGSIDLSVQQTLSLSFYSFDPNSHNIVMKLENGSGPDIQVKQTFSVPSPSNWTTVTFDFSNAQNSSDGSPVNATGTYLRLTLFIDEGNFTAGTYLIDDIDDGTMPTLDVIYEDLVWSDEFDTSGAVDANNWFHQTQVIIPGIGWANGEAQHYTNRTDNSFVDTNGFLNIVAKKETFTDQNLEKEYTSARLNSKFAFTYGRVDVRAKLPLGDGTWPAIWMLGKNINENGGYWDNQFGAINWPACGEIDIMEHGIYALNEIGAALHTPCCNGGNPNKGTVFASDVANDFHKYSVNWSPDQMTFLLDDEIFYIYNPTTKTDANWPFYTDQYLLLNIAMGGVAGTVDPSFTESSMVIDYVRVYQNNLSVDDAFANTFIVSPNPTSDYIKISTEKDMDAVELYDILGKVIVRKEEDLKRLDVTNLNSGIYVLKIYWANQFTTKRIIIN